MSKESEVRNVIGKIGAAWRFKDFEGLEDCFHPDATIVGPGYVEFARGREKCAESYREFAENARVLSYRETSPSLRIWDATAVYTFSWEMEFERELGPKKEKGTDQLVFELTATGWCLVWRFISY